jgi:hypothetical protein
MLGEGGSVRQQTVDVFVEGDEAVLDALEDRDSGEQFSAGGYRQDGFQSEGLAGIFGADGPHAHGVGVGETFCIHTYKAGSVGLL